MEVGTNERGARRKKIVERGSDRFALITGRIHTLDPPPPQNNEDHSSIHHSHTKSSPIFLSNHHEEIKRDNSRIRFQHVTEYGSFRVARFYQFPNSLSAIRHSGFDIYDENQKELRHSSVGLKGEGEQDVGDGGNAVDIGSKVEPQMRKCETTTKAIRGVRAVEFGDEVLPPVTATVPNASDEPPSKSSGAGNYFFTPKDISCCILATENTRVFCSIMIALLVILSYVNLPRNIVKPKNIIASRPLYVLLLTDFSIVIGLLILEKRRGCEKARDEEVKGTQEDEHNWGGAVTVLELGLVLHQALRAIFIDCSFYVVIVICGFSMM